MNSDTHQPEPDDSNYDKVRAGKLPLSRPVRDDDWQTRSDVRLQTGTHTAREVALALELEQAKAEIARLRSAVAVILERPPYNEYLQEELGEIWCEYCEARDGKHAEECPYLHARATLDGDA